MSCTMFCNSNSIDNFRNDEYWESVLKEKPLKAIKQFLREGMLESAELQDAIHYNFKVSDLKLMLKNRGLKVSGRKNELIQRLIDNDERSMYKATKSLDIYKCSKEGAYWADHYLNSEKSKRNAIEKEVFAHIKKNELATAVHILVQYEASQVFPRGLNVDWNNYDIKSEVNLLTTILKKTPEILKNIEKNRLNKLRLAAAMMKLWGENSIRRWLSEDFETGIHLDGNAVARMLIFYANHIHRMKSYRSSQFKMVTVSGVNDGASCPHCKEINGKKYKIENVPELPYAKCTCKLGCRCMTIAGDFF